MDQAVYGERMTAVPSARNAARSDGCLALAISAIGEVLFPRTLLRVGYRDSPPHLLRAIPNGQTGSYNYATCWMSIDPLVRRQEIAALLAGGS